MKRDHDKPPSGEPSLAARRAARKRRTVRIQSVPLWILAILAILWASVIAKSILIPITLAFILQACFSPVVRFLKARGIGRTFAATLIVLSMIGALALGVMHLAEPASRWLEELPNSTEQLRAKVHELQGSVEGVKRATEQVEELTEMESSPNKLTVVVDDSPPLMSVLVNHTSHLTISIFLTLSLLFLMLARNGEFLHNLTIILPYEDYRERARKIVLSFQREVSSYLFTITLINAALGLAVGVALWMLGVPSPALWGVMAAVLNFVPYVGAVFGIAIVGMVSLITFDSALEALVPPLVYLGLTSLEGGLVTPAVIGRQLTLSPAVVLVWLLLWGFLWGIPGALLSTPMLMAFKILCDHLHFVQPIGQLLSSTGKGKEAEQVLHDASKSARAKSLLATERPA